MSESLKKIVITLDDGQFDGQYVNAAKIDIIDKCGVKVTKYVDIDALVCAFVESKNRVLKKHRIGALPQGFLDGKIYRDDQDEISGEVLVTAPKRKTYITFEDTRFIACCPAFLFCFNIHQGRIYSTKVFALKGTNWKHSTVLYNCPLGNVSTVDNQVCWGSNSLPHIDSLQKLDVVVSLFYDSPCNNDYFTPGVSIKWKCNNLREVLSRLEKQEEFPDDLLISKGLTVEELLK